MNKDIYPHFSLSKGILPKFGFKVTNEFQLFNLINKCILKKTSTSEQEQLSVLDLRDRVLKLVRYEIIEQSRYSTMSPTELDKNRLAVCGAAECMDMCPEKERLTRHQLKQFSQFECSNSTGELDPSLMIKEYSRSCADQDLPLPNELRPLSVLHQTMKYLINEIMPRIETDKTNFPVAKWYDFIWNRSRAVRKDIVQQRLLFSNTSKKGLNSSWSSSSSISGVELIEQCARFHIICAYRLCIYPSDVFDFRINEETLKNCFQSLTQYYNSTGSPNEPEFRSYTILLNLNKTSILNEIQRWKAEIRDSAQVRFALSVYFAYTSNNYVKFFNLIRSSSCEYLQACILHRYFDYMRSRAIRSMSSAYRDIYRGKSERIYGLVKFADLLGFDDKQECRTYCRKTGHSIRDDENEFIVFGSQWTMPNRSENFVTSRLVDSKFEDIMLDWSREECLSRVISGQTSEQAAIKKQETPRSLHSSFSSDGNYIEKDLQEFFDLAELICSSRDPCLPPLKSVNSATPKTSDTKPRKIEYCEDWIEISSTTVKTNLENSEKKTTTVVKKRSRSRSNDEEEEEEESRKVSRCDRNEIVVAINDLSRSLLKRVENNEKPSDLAKLVRPVTQPLTSPILLLKANILSAQFLKQLGDR